MKDQLLDLSAELDLITITQAVTYALNEDIGSGDLTSDLIDKSATVKAEVKVREACVLCGIPWFSEVFQQLGGIKTIKWHYADGDTVPTNSVICTLLGSARSLLTGERTALNLLQLLSSTATTTKVYVDAVKGSDTKILDTRKTIPGLRAAQKYAVLCGGGNNHRQGLFDAFLIKENHISSCGGIRTAVTAARKKNPSVLLEIEVETLDELSIALTSDADRILLDNFSIEKIQEAVLKRDACAPHIKLEASGSIDLKKIKALAKTKVDYISIGALTKNVKAIDFSMRIL